MLTKMTFDDCRLVSVRSLQSCIDPANRARYLRRINRRKESAEHEYIIPNYRMDYFFEVTEGKHTVATRKIQSSAQYDKPGTFRDKNRRPTADSTNTNSKE